MALRPNNAGGALPSDARLLKCNRLQRIAEDMLVIQPDIGDDGEVGSRRVGGIQAPAETYLKDDEVTFLDWKN